VTHSASPHRRCSSPHHHHRCTASHGRVRGSHPPRSECLSLQGCRMVVPFHAPDHAVGSPVMDIVNNALAPVLVGAVVPLAAWLTCYLQCRVPACTLATQRAVCVPQFTEDGAVWCLKSSAWLRNADRGRCAGCCRPDRCHPAALQVCPRGPGNRRRAFRPSLLYYAVQIDSCTAPLPPFTSGQLLMRCQQCWHSKGASQLPVTPAGSQLQCRQRSSRAQAAAVRAAGALLCASALWLHDSCVSHVEHEIAAIG
jgi:hypothetical protein